jgi:hypothetical protein
MMESASIILKGDNGPAKKTGGMLSSLQTMPFLDKSFSYESEVKKEIGIELVRKDNSELPSCVKGKVMGKKWWLLATRDT